MLPPAPRLLQLEAHFMPYQSDSKVPTNGTFVKACGPLSKQVYDANTGLLTFTLYFTVNLPMVSPRATKEKLWEVLKRMGVFDGWYYYRIFVVDDRLVSHEQFLL
ncbi:hypothetical protein FVEG_16855 [Fusarium verticillioides 7600]|uniref:Uncharacterized protein n=1 Tax=Gibberella moniliformis (strain M3125 / FGSC 7600) TaxID=334819 RepID=W7N563_GIBM7|nr:hypothetical protein FVEG_16855 [Fusarium verticillioides 7600]EWG51782.1 hypothetical protein FVEG_16855 [Fusarium verticillioides 7600]